MIQDARYNPLELGRLLGQLTRTTDQSLINNISVNVQRATNEWLPLSMVVPISRIVSEFLIACLIKSEDSDFDHLILATIKFYAFDEPAVLILKQAMLDETWQLSHPQKSHPVILTFKEKIAFLKLLCSSRFVSS